MASASGHKRKIGVNGNDLCYSEKTPDFIYDYTEKDGLSMINAYDIPKNSWIDGYKSVRNHDEFKIFCESIQ